MDEFVFSLLNEQMPSHCAVWTHCAPFAGVINVTPTRPRWQRKALALAVFPRDNLRLADCLRKFRFPLDKVDQMKRRNYILLINDLTHFRTSLPQSWNKMYSRNEDISLVTSQFFYCKKEWTGLSPRVPLDLTLCSHPVFFSELSNQFPLTDHVTWDYSYGGRRCCRKTLAEAPEKRSTHGLQVKKTDFTALFRNVRSDFSDCEMRASCLFDSHKYTLDHCNSRNTFLETPVWPLKH